MKTLKALKTLPQTQIFQISKLKYNVEKKPHSEILQGANMIDPIEVIEHEEKRYSVYQGNQRIQAAVKLGYTHIEGIIVNDIVFGKEYRNK